VLRRVDARTPDSDPALSFPGLSVNIRNYEVRINNEISPFTPKEVELLYKLASAPGRVFSREQLLEDVWGYDYYGDTRVVDTQIKRLRRKLPESEDWEIKSIYGVGYKFEVKA